MIFPIIKLLFREIITQQNMAPPGLLERVRENGIQSATAHGAGTADRAEPGPSLGNADECYQSTESVPSPCGSGAISSSVRRSTTWMTPCSFFAGHSSAARTFSSSSSSSM